MASEREKYLAMMKASQEMLDKTTNEMIMVKKTNPKKDIADMKHINDIQEQIDQQFLNEGVEPISKQRVKRQTKVVKQSQQQPKIKQEPQQQPSNNYHQGDKYSQENPYYSFDDDKEQQPQTVEGLPKRQLPEKDQNIIDELNKQAQIVPNRNYEKFTPPISRRKYDVIPLPSKGQCYPHKKSKLPIYYLTAREEDLITSFNLYKGGLLIDSILKSTMADSEIDPDTLIQPDIDAIILFLRATAYGPEFPIIARNPNNGEEFETTILLSQIKFKEFNGVGDEYGWFDYTTGDGDLIKWTLSNRGDDRVFEKMVSDIEKNVQTYRITQMVEDLRLLGKVGFEEITQNDLIFFDNTCNKLETIKNKLQYGNDGQFYSDVLTTKMAMLTMSVNGEMDRQYVKEYIYNMRAGEARKYRKYIDENVPGLDYTIELTIPEGQVGEGETFKTTLTIDDSVFLNLSD
jgi:hypothetical protein